MFTGIIEEIGRIKRIAGQGQAMLLTIEASVVLRDVRIGDSIAVSGVCLTVTSFDANTFTVDVVPETYRRSTLCELRQGDKVNLERAMQANGRFGGHIVQGHVDSTGTIVDRKREENAVVFTVELNEPDMLKYILPKGSITLDGISLTVVDAGDRHFTVSIIPHTLAQTVLENKRPGASVNIECDILGKYVERLLAFGTYGSAAAGYAGTGAAGKPRAAGPITESFLIENGFM